MGVERLRSLVLSGVLGLAVASCLFAVDNSPHIIPNSKLRFVSTAKDLGPAQASKVITIYLWLQLRDVDSLEELVEQQYDPSSGNYHNWLTPEQFNSSYAPLPEDVATVKHFLAAYNLSVLSVDDRNLYVKAQGSIADIQRAFHVEMHQFDVHGQNYRANTADPVIEGEAGMLVTRVGGLSDYRLQPHSERRMNPETGKPSPAAPLASTPAGAFFSPYCLEPPQTLNLTNGSNLTATYSGNSYGAPLGNTALGTLAPCGYQPSELQTAYNLTPLYQHGLTGAGETNVIVDAWGSPTIASDAALFSSFYGLGGLDLNTYELGESCTSTPNTTPALCQSWAGETTLDVDAVHTAAPGSSIALVETASDNFDDLTAGIAFAISHDLGNVISNSWGAPESELGGSPYTPFDHILIMAAAHGISVNFSSGDFGDFYAAEGQIDVDYPASAPHATGIGGTSLVLNPDFTLAFQTGWGTNMTAISTPPNQYGNNAPLLPPDNSPAEELGFIAGAGGGASAVYHKPSFQRRLPGRHRMVPDISYVADPDTGMEVLCTGSSCFGLDSSIYVAVYGGTSLSCQLFSGLWAIADQLSGRPLGQAARSVYDLPPDAVSDIVPFASPFNVSGSITSGTQTYYESAFQLVQPLESPAPFLSGLFQGSLTGAWYVISFGTDTTLFTRPGWDEVTGVGTPNGWNFVNAVTPHR